MRDTERREFLAELLEALEGFDRIVVPIGKGLSVAYRSTVEPDSI